MSSRYLRIIQLLLWLLGGPYCRCALSWSTGQQGSGVVSRRASLQRVAEGVAASVVAPLIFPGSSESTAHASDVVVVVGTGSPERQALLTAIQSGANEATVLSALDALVKQDPSKGRGASAGLLDGQWKLLWSAKAEAFSPLLKLPSPLKPSSYQYIGEPAAVQIGSGRIAQTLSGGVLGPLQLWLSSGVVERSDDPSMLEIRPPFRLELEGSSSATASPKTLIVEAGSDADFRAVNARTEEAQQAPPNQYQQIYVEDGPGALRISTIVEGDPVIVGAIFVHQKV